MKLTFEVTAKDIKKGAPGTVDGCPIYLGIKRVNQELSSVSDTKIRFGYHKCYKIPAILQNFIDKFDNGQKVKPFKGTFSFRKL